MNLETLTAIYAGNVSIGYGALIAFVAVISSWLFTFSLVTSTEGETVSVSRNVRRIISLIIYLLLFVLLGGSFGRLVQWYSHFEVYGGFGNAFRAIVGSYHEAGMIFGFVLAAFFSSLICEAEDRKKFFSAGAVGQMLFMTLVSLVSMFNTSDRGKAVITDPEYQRLPFSVLTQTDAGETEYRTAVFFWKFMVLLFITLLSFIFYFAKKSVLYTYVCYFSAMALLDSARYDASFLRSNGFVSLMQIVAALVLLTAITVSLVVSIKANGFKPWHILSILVFLSGLGLTIYMEYYVQRHGDLYIYCYPVMALACTIMALSVILTFGSRYLPERRARKNQGSEN